MFGEPLLRALLIKNGFEGVTFLIEHRILFKFYMSEQDWNDWEALQQWLKDSCVGRHTIIGTDTIAFSHLDDAMMFKLSRGGTLREVIVEPA